MNKLVLLFISFFIGGTSFSQIRHVEKASQNGPVKATAIKTSGYENLPSQHRKVSPVDTDPNISKTKQNSLVKHSEHTLIFLSITQ